MTASNDIEREITRYILATEDLTGASRVARLLADHDPLFDWFGMKLAALEAAARGGHDARENIRRAEALIDAFQDGALTSVVETGVIVTYARPFVEGRGIGFPLSSRFVPAEFRDLHRFVLKLRQQVQAHTDELAPRGFQRRVTLQEEPGSSSMSSRGPRRISPEELRSLADLADAIVLGLETAVEKARSALRARTVSHSMPPSTEKAGD